MISKGRILRFLNTPAELWMRATAAALCVPIRVHDGEHGLDFMVAFNRDLGILRLSIGPLAVDMEKPRIEELAQALHTVLEELS